MNRFLPILLVLLSLLIGRASHAESPDPAATQASTASTPQTAAMSVNASPEGCRDPKFSAFSRLWELERGSECGTLTMRGYRPINVSVSAADGTPQIPTSPAEGHTGKEIAYQSSEMRIGLSMRTKLAQGLFTGDGSFARDSLWFGYTQESTWQLFNGALSRPFRTTDHEPELIYVRPTDVGLFGDWRLRYSGVGLVHQSNGQALPYSRSWNRLYLMGGMELGDQFDVSARIWKRLPESTATDDNPDIASYIGRAELSGRWYPDRSNTFSATVRNNLRANGHGSVRLEWFRAIGEQPRGNLRFHMQLFHGYGDTMVDYNRKRTVLTIGLSLMDF